MVYFLVIFLRFSVDLGNHSHILILFCLGSLGFQIYVLSELHSSSCICCVCKHLVVFAPFLISSCQETSSEFTVAVE